MSRTPPPTWTVPVRLDDVPDSGLSFDLAPDALMRDALAKAAGVNAVPRLSARFDVTRRGHDGLHVTGKVSATVRQTCVVTLEPLENEIEEAVDVTFVPDHERSGEPIREDELGAHDPPEALVGGTVDLGIVTTEFLILGIDPYPRKSGVVFTPPESEDPADHPFAALAALKDRR
jgi:uncharacterized metal-binding protein YceD (DUF177 family)